MQHLQWPLCLKPAKTGLVLRLLQEEPGSDRRLQTSVGPLFSKRFQIHCHQLHSLQPQMCPFLHSLFFLYRNDSIPFLRDSKPQICFHYFEQLLLDVPGTTEKGVTSLLFIWALCAFEINVSSRSRRWDFRTLFHCHIQICRSIGQPQRDFWLPAQILPWIPWQERVRYLTSTATRKTNPRVSTPSFLLLLLLFSSSHLSSKLFLSLMMM